MTYFVRSRLNYLFLNLLNYAPLNLLQPTPNLAEIRVTERCNSRCITCDAWKNTWKDELTTEEIVDALRQLKTMSVKNIRISGGEPLIRSDLPKIVQECRSAGFGNIELATNGLLLQLMGEELLKSGVTHFCVSLDGLERTNDYIRGVPRDYRRVLKGIETIKGAMEEGKKDIPVTVFSTLLKLNIRQVPSLLELCRKIGARWCFSLLDGNLDFFREIDISNLKVTDPKVVDKTINYLRIMKLKEPELVYSTDEILEYARNYLKGTKQDEPPCTLGYKVICIGSRGEVYPGCYVMGAVGSIRKNKLVEIVNSNEYRKMALKMLKRECPGCTFYYEDNIIQYVRARDRIKKLLPSGEKIRNLLESAYAR